MKAICQKDWFSFCEWISVQAIETGHTRNILCICDCKKQWRPLIFSFLCILRKGPDPKWNCMMLLYRPEFCNTIFSARHYQQTIDQTVWHHVHWETMDSLLHRNKDSDITPWAPTLGNSGYLALPSQYCTHRQNPKRAKLVICTIEV